jgi:hypothetical protein
MNRYIMFGRDICEKYQSRDEKFPDPKDEGNLVSRLVFFKLPNSFGILHPLSHITNRNTTTVPAEGNSSKRPIVFNN